MKKLFLYVLSVVFSLGMVQGASKPNIILINADDLGWAELGSYGQEKIKTPHLDKLAAEGQRWTQFYSGAPVCAPSRNVLMTGRHIGGCDVQDLKRVDYSEVWGDLKGDWPITQKSYTLPESMKKAGYATGVFGKWGLGEYDTTGGPSKHGIDDFYGYTDHRLCHTFYPPFVWKNGKKVVINKRDIPGHAQKLEGEVKAEDYRSENHASEMIIDEAVKFIAAKAKEDKPFFMYYAPLEPHVAMQPLQQWVDIYPKEWDKEPYRGDKGYLPHPRPRAAYAGMISQMDNNVGRLIAELKKAGIEKNTLVIFTSDNGTTHDVGGVDHKFFNTVRGLKGLKGQLYEGGIRVPGIICWPGKVPAGKVITQPAYGADIMPTLAAMAGAQAGNPTGIDLSAVVLGKADNIKNRRPMVWGGGGYGGQIAVRIGDKKVLRRQLFPNKKKSPLDWEVYDIEKDPLEKNNIAASEKELIAQAKEILAKEYGTSEGFPQLRYTEEETHAEDMSPVK